MLILSQDRRAIVNLDKLKTIELDKFSNYKSIKIFRETDEVEAGVCELCIGEYETEERAKEVLQEIMDAYSHFIYYNNQATFIMPKDRGGLK